MEVLRRRPLAMRRRKAALSFQTAALIAVFRMVRRSVIIGHVLSLCGRAGTCSLGRRFRNSFLGLNSTDHSLLLILIRGGALSVAIIVIHKAMTDDSSILDIRDKNSTLVVSRWFDVSNLLRKSMVVA